MKNRTGASRTKKLVKKLSLIGLIGLLGTSTSACGFLFSKAVEGVIDASIPAEEYDYEEEEYTLYDYSDGQARFEVSEKTISFSAPYENFLQLKVGNHSDVENVKVQTSSDSSISVEYSLIARKGDDDNSLENIDVDSGRKSNLLAVALPNLNGCSRAIINDVMNHLDGVCEKGVVITIPETANLDIYVTDFYSDLDKVGSDSIFHDLIWPKQVPSSVQSLTEALSSVLDEDIHRTLLIKRFVESGKAANLTAADCIAIADELEESWAKRSAIEHLSAPLKASYSSRDKLISDLEPLLDELDISDYEKAVESLS